MIPIISVCMTFRFTEFTMTPISVTPIPVCMTFIFTMAPISVTPSYVCVHTEIGVIVLNLKGIKLQLAVSYINLNCCN